MTVLIKKDIAIEKLEGEFETLLENTFAAEPQWLKEKRKTAFEHFFRLGIPGKKDEEYKYTDVKKIFSKNFSAIHNEVHDLKLDIEKLQADAASVKLVFVNGWLYKDSTLTAELPEGTIVGSMANDGLFLHADILKKNIGTITAENDPFALLNSALWFDGAFIFIPEGRRLEKNIEIIHISTGQKELLVNPRHLIIAGKNSEAYITEHFISLDAKQIIVNASAEIVTGENAHVSFYKIQSGNKNVFQLHNTFAKQDRDSV